MKTYEQILERAQKAKSFDGRDVSRLIDFLKREDAEPLLDLSDPKAAAWLESHVPAPLTREEALRRLESDLGFAFEKALNRRGISSACMFEVIRMWDWILEDGLEDWDEDDYAMYGLPLYRATALRYGFDNPIGGDSGREAKYDG